MATPAKRTPQSSRAPYRLQLRCPTEAADIAQAQLMGALEETALDDWFTVAAPVPGLWALWWDDQMIWTGFTVDPRAWAQALLESWWGSGGGCC